ncbi:hypothetical protein BO83DRAFT_459319 [Aspergillus eucalypticola CBS 122712]|uniref:Condensation domain-containing protein n=1 Tax=Aspergillus eucalypticola (strain CBS 122712 / IBT 29274) TaxID=1448314 RepID=A0A317ULR3_ASPEC|nr:uncharacterized protein BO83DRAFT_459319 [Aspergillus eucalypticola CBS 122712]PWY62086.1 hypothetical protein BO83DRAFT_459319 [Aspergillus eucalypticola CBS 122712]
MYTGALIDNAEMGEWLDGTIDALLGGGPPGHVFEVGTGTGMILFNITAGLESYTALEPSGTAVDFVRAAVTTIPDLQGKVRLEKETADNISNLDGSNSVDVAVINSVAQYFPSPEYLLKVVEDIVCLQGAKRIFLGDIRSYALYEEFQVSKTLAGDRQKLLTLDGFRSQMAETVHMGEELLLSMWKSFSSVMVATNELSCYRYAAVLHTKNRQAQPRHIHDVEEGQWVDFSVRRMTHASLLEYLQQPTIDASVVAIGNIPYKKTILDRLIVDQLKGRLVDRVGGPGWLESLDETARHIPSLAPVDLIKLAELSGYQVEISWARQQTQRGGLDAIFHHIRPDRRGSRVLFRFPTDHDERPLRQLSNNPLQQASNRDIEKWVREALHKKLPPYMVPRIVRVLEQISVNSNGKVDRRALANKITVAAFHNTVNARVDPHDDVERVLLAAFTKMLGRNIGISESFFDHEGHSLNAMRLISGINQNSILAWRSAIFSSVRPLPAWRQGSDHGRIRCMKLSPLSASHRFPLLEAFLLSRWTRVFMHFDIHGRIDVIQLRTACLVVMQKHSILRTVFTRLEGQSVQVVLREPNVPFTYGSLSSEFHDEVVPETTPVPTKLPAEYELVSRSQTDHSIIVRLLHAQCDGASLSLLFAGLETAYSGQLLSPTIAVPFADYVYGCAQLRSAESPRFWKDFIWGASLTTLPNPTLAEDNAADVTTIVAGELPTPPPGITLAMLVKAFAFTLAEMATTEDVTFLLGLNTRGIPIKGVEAIVGPCINRCPIRVQLRQTWTVSNLCQSVYDNYVAISRHCHLELPDIIDNCTYWPSGSDFSCGLNHVSTSGCFSFSLKHTQTLHSSIDAQVNMANRLYVRSFAGDRTWRIQVLASSNVMNNERASLFASMLLRTGQRFSQYPEAPLSSPLLR